VADEVKDLLFDSSSITVTRAYPPFPGPHHYHRNPDNHPSAPLSCIHMQDRCYYTYMVASRSRVIYIGVTSNIERRVAEHKGSASKAFTAMYRCHRLVWYER
jgi:hypothetical protein